MANFTEPSGQESFIFFKEFQILSLIVCNLWIFIVLFGIASNTINITVFIKIGFRDNVTVTLLFLSISDLFNLLFDTPTVVKWFMDQNTPNYPWSFSEHILELLFYWYAYTFYDYSSFISVFLGLVRCACVARPLLFKSMFTITRTLVILAALFVAAIAMRAPVLSVFSLAWGLNPRTNSTWMTIRVANNFREIYRINDVFNRNVVTWVAYIIAVVCVIVLVTKLQAASRFRQSLTSQAGGIHRQTTNRNTTHSSSRQGTSSKNRNCSSTQDEARSVKDPNNQNEKSVIDPNCQNDKISSNKMSAKDLQVIRSVTLICAIFILSQLPFQVISTIRLFDPEFSTDRSKKYAYGFATIIASTCRFLNASVNIFVYYYFNSRYRETFHSLLCRKPA